MKNRSLPVIAVIPAHNASKTLPSLLDELLKQKYDEIIVIDDASTDSTISVARAYKNKVNIIEGKENVGSGANRNRIIGRTKNSIIHFIDADMQLLSRNTPGIIRTLDWPDDTAFIGGMVRNPDGTQNPFNYGPRPHLMLSFLLGGLQFLVWQIGRLNRSLGQFTRRIFNPLLRDFPKIYQIQKPKRIYWAAESNMLVESNLFEKHGGYDPAFRYSEIEDFALRMYRHGYHGRFEPRIDAIHSSTDNIFKSRKKRYEARKQFIKKHGRLVYLVPPLADYLEGRKTQKRYHK
ncbi:MAG TPA: glycosyltransferase family 2 protein [Candidatus Saccharimonadales bacterium]|nr:glycosyltransferase family 2 protein [Candidatus Saccharimonadales bacterium]